MVSPFFTIYFEMEALSFVIINVFHSDRYIKYNHDCDVTYITYKNSCGICIIIIVACYYCSCCCQFFTELSVAFLSQLRNVTYNFMLGLIRHEVCFFNKKYLM